MDVQNKKIAVLGAGVEGQSARTYLLAQNAVVDVFERLDDVVELAQYEWLVRSPGIRPDHPLILEAQKKGSKLTSATQIFFENTPTAQIIGVTGTKGKGTTSTLIYQMLQQDGRDVYLGGNIGTSPLDFINQLKHDSWVVLELSSFQLMDLTKSPHIAVVLMVTSEHMDWHTSVEEYLAAKSQIVRNQVSGDVHVVNIEYENSRRIVERTTSKRVEISVKNEVKDGCYVKDGCVVWSQNGSTQTVAETSQIKLPGRHNWENVCAAVAAGQMAGVGLSAIQQAITSFSGLEHRIELVGDKHGVKYYNDSFSTVPETSIAAIEAFDEPKVLILGGSGKQSDFTDLAKTIAKSSTIRAIIGVGKEWERIKSELSAINYQPPTPYIEGLATMKEIVGAAMRCARAGDVVLLSPACASFGMFENYKDRGKQFKAAVAQLDAE